MEELTHKVIEENGPFPNNPKLPFLHYKHVLEECDPNRVLEKFAANGWKNGWINGIYPFHHFHSNTHEALGMTRGSCKVQIGGEGGEIFEVEAGDVLVIPAGVSHKNVGASADFQCVGCYPLDISYDMHRGKESELEKTKQAIKHVPFPEKDPVFGKSGPLMRHWINH